jgi:hypothetical protein
VTAKLFSIILEHIFVILPIYILIKSIRQELYRSFIHYHLFNPLVYKHQSKSNEIDVYIAIPSGFSESFLLINAVPARCVTAPAQVSELVSSFPLFSYELRLLKTSFYRIQHIFQISVSAHICSLAYAT